MDKLWINPQTKWINPKTNNFTTKRNKRAIMETAKEIKASLTPEWMDKQFTTEQAIAIYESKVWKEWTDEQVIRFQLFQQLLCVSFARFHGALEKVFRYPFTQSAFIFHKGMVIEYMRRTEHDEPPTFDEIVGYLPEELRNAILTETKEQSNDKV